MNKLMLPLSLAIVAALSGCASVQYECPLKTQPEAKCASMQDAYRTANKTGNTTGGMTGTDRQSVFDRSSKEVVADAAQNKPFFKGEDSGFPEAGERGMPVFKQPEVHRVWVAPYVDSDGNLRTGEYTYFSTPGKWNYGTTRRAGEGSAIFGPQKPGNLGFVPVTPETKKDRPAAPPGPNSSNSNAGKSTAAPDSVGTITQPAQRITQ
jgi:conjugal transfer pilus assembly protein TraV